MSNENRDTYTIFGDTNPYLTAMGEQVAPKRPGARPVPANPEARSMPCLPEETVVRGRTESSFEAMGMDPLEGSQERPVWI